MLVVCDEQSPGNASSPVSGSGGSGSVQSGSAAAGSAAGGATPDAGAPLAGAGSISVETGGEAGSPTAGDGAGGSGGEGGADSSCVTIGTELCDDFESGAIDPTLWVINKPTDSASVSIDGEHVHSGTQALHVKVLPGEQSTAQITETGTFPAFNDAFYTRIFAYFAPDLPSDESGGFHMGFVQASGDNDLGHVRSALGSIADKQFLGYSIYFGPPFVEFGPWSDLRVTPNTWLCLELFVSGDGGTVARRRIWVNDTELAEQESSYDGQQPPTFDKLAIGVWQYHPTPTFSDMWIDDVRVSRERIGCAK